MRPAAAKRYVPGAPVPVYITTEGGAPITSRDDYVNGVMLLDGVNHVMEIRGRGNSTWTWPKKPYKIKLANDVALLGTEPRDEWVLLANYADRTALRTYLAMGLASSSGLPWTPRTRFVDVVLNGVPQGLYLLTDQVEQGTERVDLPDDSYLLEVNTRFRRQGDRGFWSEHGIPISYKDPDEPKKSERKLVRSAIHRFEKALYGKNFADPKFGYRAHIDLDSFINWYLVEELFHNQDSNFFSSVHFTWTPGGDIAMGPVWDFDLSAGTKWNGTSSTRGLLHPLRPRPLDQPDVRGPRVHGGGEAEVGRAAPRRRRDDRGDPGGRQRDPLLRPEQLGDLADDDRERAGRQRARRHLRRRGLLPGELAHAPGPRG